jgi:hypothetical protein
LSARWFLLNEIDGQQNGIGRSESPVTVLHFSTGGLVGSRLPFSEFGPRRTFVIARGRIRSIGDLIQELLSGGGTQ